MIVEQVQNTLSTTLQVNRRMMGQARERFITRRRSRCEGPGCPTETPVRADVPFDISGDAEYHNGVLATRGFFFELRAAGDGRARRVLFGDFDLRRDVDGSVSAQITGRLAWERDLSDRTMLGYFVGADYTRATIEGTFAVHRNGYGLMAGAYLVSELHQNLYADGYLTLGLGQNSLNISDGTLAVDDDFDTRTITFGGTLSGVYAGRGFEIWPALSLDIGHSNIGRVGLTGFAHGGSLAGLSLDAGAVSIAQLSFEPEFKLALDGRVVADSDFVLSLAPRLLCEMVWVSAAQARSTACGGGASFGVTRNAADGLGQLSARLYFDRLGGATRAGFEFTLERRF